MNFWERIKKQFQEGSVLTRIILINAGVFALVVGVSLISTLSGMEKGWMREILAFPASFKDAMLKPWTIITYMFTHMKLFHLLFNLLALYVFGQLFLKWLDENRFLAVYLLGGIAGAAMYLLAYTVFPALILYSSSSTVVGASASIYAIMCAIAVLTPKHKVGIPMIAQVELMRLALIFLGIDVISIAFDQPNIGGHFAHLGGALFGFLFGYLHKNGFDITAWLTAIIKGIRSIFKPREKMKVTYKSDQNKTRHETDMEYNARKTAEQEEVNRILDKIGKSGYDSLTKKEKEILFKSSKK